MTTRVALAGAGAFGVKHLEALTKIQDVRVVSLVGRELEKTREVATKFGVAHVTTELNASLVRDDVDGHGLFYFSGPDFVSSKSRVTTGDRKNIPNIALGHFSLPATSSRSA